MTYTIVLGADSLLDPEELAPALALGYVFSPATPQGFIPSEGAGGVLLFNADLAPDYWWLHAAIVGPVMKTTRSAVHDLSGVMSAAIAQSGKCSSDIGAVLSDSDHSNSGITEVVAAMRSIFASLDPFQDRISPMENAGSFGAATDMINLVLAAELAGERTALVLSAFNGQPSSLLVISA